MKKKEKKKKKNNKNKINNKLIICLTISLILTFFVEYILVKSKTYTSFSIGRIIAVYGIIFFVIAHFIFGLKKLYNTIVEKRFIFSIAMIIISTIVGYLQNIYSIKVWITSTNIPLCLWWNVEFYALLLISYELFMIITAKNKEMSIVGSIAIALSGAVQYNFAGIALPIILGELSVVVLEKIINSDSKIKKYIYMIIYLLNGIIYTSLDKSYCIPLGYVFAALIVWLVIINIEKVKEKKSNLIILILGLISSTLYSIFFTGVSESYNGLTRNSALLYVFSYLINILLPFYEIPYKPLLGNFISLFPIPILVGLYYMYKSDDKKHLSFLFPITIVGVFETVYCLSGFPAIISNVLGFKYVNIPNCSMALGLLSVYILFYMMGNFEKRLFSLKKSVKITFVTSILVLFIPLPIEIMNNLMVYFLSAELCCLAFLFYNNGGAGYKRTLLLMIVILTVFSGAFVNPIIKEKGTISLPIESKYEELQN